MYLVFILFLIVDNGLFVEIYKIVFIFFCGKIYRSFVYLVVFKFGFYFLKNLYCCFNVLFWNKMMKKLENEYILECMIMEGIKRYMVWILM